LLCMRSRPAKRCPTIEETGRFYKSRRPILMKSSKLLTNAGYRAVSWAVPAVSLARSPEEQFIVFIRGERTSDFPSWVSHRQ